MAKKKKTSSSRKTGVARAKAAENVYQMKITLCDAKPPIWRRIQVKDCTLDQLHEHIQNAMGWENYHLYEFSIGKQGYGDLGAIEAMEDFGNEDSTKTMLSSFLPADGCTFRFRYHYDFGDSWMHDIVLEKRVQAEPGQKYPICVTGKRACPPEDCGGVWGYAEFLKAIGNKKHRRHREMKEWIGGSFDPEEFSAAETTEAMQARIPD